MLKKLLILIVLLFTSQASAQNSTTAYKEGWSELNLNASIAGCTLARVDSTRKDYVARGQEKGNPNAAEEFPVIEDIVRDEMNKSCQCIYQHIAYQWIYSEYMQNMQTISVSPFMQQLVTPPNGKCSPNMDTFKTRILERKNKINQLKK